MASDFLFTSESVSEGHPDKVSDQISDAILDACIEQDPLSRVAAETLCTTGLVVLAGEITTKADVDYEGVVRRVLKRIGYVDEAYGIDAKTCQVRVCYDKQSPDIKQGVDEKNGDSLTQGAGDQDALAFAVGHAVHRFAGESLHADQPERTGHDVAVGLLHASNPVGVGGAAEGHDVFAGEVGDAHLVGGDEADARSPLERGERREGFAAEFDPAGRGGAQTGDGPQQGTLAGAVAADQSRERSRRDRGRDVAQQDALAVGEGDMAKGDAHFRRDCGCGRLRRSPRGCPSGP